MNEQRMAFNTRPNYLNTLLTHKLKTNKVVSLFIYLFWHIGSSIIKATGFNNYLKQSDLFQCADSGQ